MSRTAVRLWLLALVVATATASSLDLTTARPATVARATSAPAPGRLPGSTGGRSIEALALAINALVDATNAEVAVSFAELGGGQPLAWSLNGDDPFIAASTYKLAALMMLAQRVASGATDPQAEVCFDPSDYEAGWFDDYAPGACFTREELAERAGIYSDNTAGHMLVRDLGGGDAVNAWAQAAGATHSAFFDPNVTTANDLADLWIAESTGALGGRMAQAWLSPFLRDTATEAGIPAGTPAGVDVVHKTGSLDPVFDDSALITGGPAGPYTLTVLTSGLGEEQAWPLIAQISSAAWSFETRRAAAQ